MLNIKKKIRHNALIIFPDVSLNRNTFKDIKEGGYDLISISVARFRKKQFPGQSFGIDDFYKAIDLCREFNLKIQVFTGYQKYSEDTLKDHPERKMICTNSGTDSDNLHQVDWLCPSKL